MDFDLGLEGFEMEAVFEATILGVLGRLCPQSVPVPLPVTATLTLCQTVLPQLLVGPTEGSVSLSLAPRRWDPPSGSAPVALPGFCFILAALPAGKHTRISELEHSLQHGFVVKRGNKQP